MGRLANRAQESKQIAASVFQEPPHRAHDAGALRIGERDVTEALTIGDEVQANTTMAACARRVRSLMPVRLQ